ncbi:MAG: acyltransferase family protein [Lachnospiraceae bacterium]|nr:acyltransferase family protein [Lachnospiraceae bacterium]
MRKYYMDNLRWFAILLLFPFHAAQIWSGGEYSGFYIWSHTNTLLFVFSTAVYPWYMTFLFVLAGISCKYALQKRTNRQFIAERTKKLLIPFIFGLLVLVPVMTYIAELFFNGYTGTYLQQYRLFFTKETDLTGYHGGFTPAHLWFLLYLFIISLAALFIIHLQKKCLPRLRVGSFPYFVIILLFLPEWLFTYILNISGKSLGQFMILFLFGYYILSEEHILQTVKNHRLASLAICILSGSLYTWLYCFENIRSIWMTGLYIFFGWMGIIALLGIGQSKLDFQNSLSNYLTSASFVIYILHMPILVVVGFFVLKLPVNVLGQFSLIILISLIITFLVYEIIKKVPVLRFFLGISRHYP